MKTDKAKLRTNGPPRVQVVLTALQLTLLIASMHTGVAHAQIRSLFQFGGTVRAGDGQMNLPTHIFIDHSGRVLVADTYNHRIQVFSRAGKFLMKFGSFGTG